MRSYIILIFLSLLVIIHIIFLIRSYLKNKLTSKQLSISAILLLLSLALLMPLNPYWGPNEDNIFNSKNLILGITEMTVSNIYYIFTLLTLFSTFIYPIYHVYIKKPVNEIPAGKVDEFLNKFYSDEKFHTAFSTVLPKGKEDEDLGIDYIPFMLQNIENKRKRFETASVGFLYTSITLGIVFIILVVYFGMILLNESSVGISKTVKDLKKELNLANESYIRLHNTDYIPLFKNLYRIDIDEVHNYLFKQSDSISNALWYGIQDFKANKNFTRFYSQLDTINNYYRNNPFRKNDTLDNFFPTFKSIYIPFTDFKESKIKSEATFLAATNAISTYSSKIDDEIKKQPNQINELIKRLILSIVIITFFLAILKYVASLYKENHKLMTQAEDDDLAIRKFYVALKNTDKNQEERKIVIESFLKRFESDGKGDASNPNLNKEESNLLKEMLNNITKKL